MMLVILFPNKELLEQIERPLAIEYIEEYDHYEYDNKNSSFFRALVDFEK